MKLTLKILQPSDVGTHYRRMITAATQRQHGVKVNPNWTINPSAPGAHLVVVRGKWCAVCPDCNNTAVYEFGEPFFCNHCLNYNVGYKSRVVAMPDRQTLAAIEGILLARPEQDSRNWEIGETVEDLIAENEAFLGGD